MKIDCVADLHGYYPDMIGGDLLIIAGDCTTNDSFKAWGNFFDWLKDQKYEKKIIIGGNHDNFLVDCLNNNDQKEFNNNFDLDPQTDFEYLCDSGCEFHGLKIWGSPWTRWFDRINPRCTAFTLKTDEELELKWAMIPEDTNILITHSPSFGFLDMTKRNENVGSKSLLKNVRLLKNLRLHVFGHVHEAYGVHDNGKLVRVNCSFVDADYEPIHKAVRIFL